MIRYGMALNPESAERDEFNLYYNLFIEKFVGEFTLRSCFFLGNLFENLFQRWRKQFDYNSNDYDYYGLFPHDSTYYMQEKVRKETRKLTTFWPQWSQSYITLLVSICKRM